MATNASAMLALLLLAGCEGSFRGGGDPSGDDAREPGDASEDVPRDEAGEAPGDETLVEDVPAEQAEVEDPAPEDLPEEEGPCTPVPAPTATASDIFSRAGVMIAESTSAFPAGSFGSVLRDNHFSWVAVQIVNGEGVNEEAAWDGWIASWRCYLPYVGAWGVNRTSPEAEADLAADKVARHDFAFYIADAEQEYKYSQEPDYCGECFERSGRWIAEFSSRLAGHGLPDLPVALTSFGRVDLADLDWRVWSDSGFHFLPQAYWNEYPIYQPSECVRAAVTWIRPEVEDSPFWTADQVHPMIGIWDDRMGARQYLDDLAAARTAYGQLGFSVYRGDSCPSGEWPVLGQGVVEGLAASPP